MIPYVDSRHAAEYECLFQSFLLVVVPVRAASQRTGRCALGTNTAGTTCAPPLRLFRTDRSQPGPGDVKHSPNNPIFLSSGPLPFTRHHLSTSNCCRESNPPSPPTNHASFLLRLFFSFSPTVRFSSYDVPFFSGITIADLSSSSYLLSPRVIPPRRDVATFRRRSTAAAVSWRSTTRDSSTSSQALCHRVFIWPVKAKPVSFKRLVREGIKKKKREEEEEESESL